ncbi:cytoplasmic dynein 2 light intermediate chain 1 isoform X2 [Leptopilina boulardi]|uniref:cytoplasmic dynein 2 light intermediate chain 1 isoform X2 n=1 Tax=Leptopilina boulardi TaxID=63433 RepID=UPI0021F556D9|nr:cytoplasmic dynein 2 light intermediate chain 1 isoform X2 [Leptopilina boulardi]
MSEEYPLENTRELALRLSLEEENKRKNDGIETHERSIILLGSQGVGKTTMIYRFLDKDDTPKSTIAMDYSFGRKAGKSLIKDVIHVWEVGHLSSSLISAAMIGSTLIHSPHHVTIMIMLDLSKPEMIWSSLEESLSVVRSAMKMSYNEKLIESMNNRRIREKRKDTEKSVDPFPMRLCIIGGKYDEFKEFDSTKKGLIGRILRATAHALGATLHFHSSKDSALVRRTKDLLSFYGFGSQTLKGNCADYEKPLTIIGGTDSFMAIELDLPGRLLNLEKIKQIFISRIPQGTREEIKLDDPANHPSFSEPIIDRLKNQREEEISFLLNEMLEGRSTKIPVPDPI